MHAFVHTCDPEDLGACVAEIELAQSMALYHLCDEKAIVEKISATFYGYYKLYLIIIIKYLPEDKVKGVVGGGSLMNRFVAKIYGL